ncbi:MAG: cellulose synthase (UDP-forming) [Methyloprofundus sp.]|nr:MAG: cellulose synthase (UDP-forming) [Methyloprofundus sp.]
MSSTISNLSSKILILSIILASFLASIPVDTISQILLSVCVVGLMFFLAQYAEHKGVARIYYLGLCTFIVIRYILWRFFFTLEFNELASFIASMILFLTEVYVIYMFLVSSFVSLRPIERSVLPLPEDESVLPCVDVFIPSYDEEQSLLVVTLIAALNMHYPKDKLKIYLLDDGGTLAKRQQSDVLAAEQALARHKNLQQLCSELGVIYLTRDHNEHAKAGNLNAALAKTSGELVLVIDADHVPTLDFLQKTVGHFLQDDKLFLVQTPHFFINPDPIEKNLDLYQNMPAENYMFYGAVQLGLDFWNASFFCGSAAVLRRAALLESDGFSCMTVTEDAETALTLHNKGWRSRYYKYPLISGLQPETFSSFMTQRMRWAQGMVQIFLLQNPALQSGMSLPQKISYLSNCSFWFFPLSRMVFALAPAAYLVFGLYVYNATLLDLFTYTIPYLLVLVMSSSYLFGKVRWNFISNIYETMQSMYSFGAIIQVLKNPESPTFGVTPKSEILSEDFISPLSKPFYWMIAITTLIFFIGCARFYWFPEERSLIIPALFWTSFNFIFYSASLGALLERKQRRTTPRLPANFNAILEDTQNNTTMNVYVCDISVGGASIKLLNNDVCDINSKKLMLCGMNDITEEPFKLPVAVKDTWQNLGKQLLGVQFDTSNMEDLRAVVLLVHGDSQRWQQTIEQASPDPGFTHGMYFLAKTGIVYIARYTFMYFRGKLSKIRTV